MQIHGRWAPARFNKTYRLYGKTVTNRINYFFKRYGDLMALGICLRFSIAAAKYTPPKNKGRWATTIDNAMYYRPIQDLRVLAKGGYPRYHASKKDYQMLRQGFYFRVMNTKYRHAKKDAVYAYCKGINEAKRISKIQNRGLSKYSWGSMINNLHECLQSRCEAGVDIKAGGTGIYQTKTLPPLFLRLAKKSPSIQKYKWGSFNWKDTGNQITFTIKNRLAEIQRYGQIAIQMGARAAKDYANKLLRAAVYTATYPGVDPRELPNASQQQQEAARLRKMIGKLFDEVKGYGIQQFRVTGTTSHVPKGSTVHLNIK